MKSVLVLVTTFLLSLIFIKYRQKKWRFALAGQIAMAGMLLFTAISHFVFTEDTSLMMPDFVPLKREMVYLIGVLEIVLAVGLLIPKYRNAAAWSLIVFFVLVLPANIKAALENINYLAVGNDEKEVFDLWFGVPLHLCFILWVYFSTLKQ